MIGTSVCETIRSIWIVGMPFAGKTTLAHLLIARLRAEGQQCVCLDGDDVRDVFDRRLGFDPKSRRKQTARMLRLTKLMVHNKTLPVTAMIHPFNDDRKMCRDAIPGSIMIVLECDFKELMRRDSKKLYIPALRGDRKHVVGVDIPFDAPDGVDLVIDTGVLDPEQMLDAAWQFIVPRLLPQS